jgi:hypothetical protein
VGGRGKCPGAPSHHLKEGEDRQNGIGKRKNRRPKRYRKKPYGKNGNGIKLKIICIIDNFILRYVLIS